MRMSVSALALLGVLTALSSAPVFAQTAPATEPVVDESALRYFARQGDQRRLEAEIARLSAIYPGWEPPADPLAEETGIDEQLQALWDIYATGDLDALHEAIEARRAAEPGWVVPDDLARAVQEADARAAIVAASDAGDDEQVVALAATYPQLLECQNMDTLWRLGEAFVDTGREERGLDLYTYILKTCDNPVERLATMQKAAAMLGSDGIEPLFALERDVEGKPEFGSILIDFARQNIAEALNGVSGRADAQSLDMVRSHARAEPNVGDLQLLGYYELDQGQTRAARDWFRQAYELEPSAETANALAIALMQFGDAAGAEETLAEYRSESPEAERLYLDAASAALTAKPVVTLDEDALARISEAVSDARDASGAHNLGWYAYQFRQYRTAAQWFEAALAFDPSMEAAAYGLVVTSNQLRDTARIRELQQEWGDFSPRIRLFGRPGAPTEAPARFILNTPQQLFRPAMQWVEVGSRPVALFQLVQGQTQGQIRAAQQSGSFVPVETISPNAALPRAWCLMEINRNAEAEATFRKATQAASETVRTEAYYGLALALLRLGLPNDAAIAAGAMPQTPERAQELQVAILADSAVAYCKIGKFEEALQALNLRAQLAPERNDLLIVRAWSYYHLGYRGEARRLFAAVAATGNSDAQRALDSMPQ